MSPTKKSKLETRLSASLEGLQAL